MKAVGLEQNSMSIRNSIRKTKEHSEIQSAGAFQSKRNSFYASVWGRGKQGLMCCNEKGRVSTDGAGKKADFRAFKSPTIRCLTQLIVVTKVQDLNLSEKRSVTESLFRLDVFKSAGSDIM